MKHNSHCVCFVIAERIDGLETQVVSIVASGEMHSVAVNDAGRIFTWGDNHFSQLGRQTPSEVISSVPKSVVLLLMAINGKTGQFTTRCKGNRVIALKQQKSLW